MIKRFCPRNIIYLLIFKCKDVGQIIVGNLNQGQSGFNQGQNYFNQNQGGYNQGGYNQGGYGNY